MVDSYLAPSFKGFEDQIKIYAFGKLDGSFLGGNSTYGKLHAKYTVLDSKRAFVGTSNLDPRSRYLHSEVQLFMNDGDTKGITGEILSREIDKLVSQSYLWGSREWNAVRSHHKMRLALLLERFTIKLIRAFNLIPLI